jgi:hypothetical protein
MARMTELDEGDTRWTDEARESFRTAAANLVEAIHRHSATLLELTTTTDDEVVDEALAGAEELLEAAATAYADAQFELSGTVPPLGLDEEDEYSYDEHDALDEHDEHDEHDELDGLGDHDELEELEDLEQLEDTDQELTDAGEPDHKLTVLHRADFVVTDELSVIQAGKDAYHEAADPSDEPVDVSDIGEALHQLRQAGGIEALAETPGLASAGATTWIIEATELLDERDPEEWHAPFATATDAPGLLHRVDELAG